METFIHTRSEADFSHGYCPDCMKKVRAEYSHLFLPDERSEEYLFILLPAVDGTGCHDRKLRIWDK